MIDSVITTNSTNTARIAQTQTQKRPAARRPAAPGDDVVGGRHQPDGPYTGYSSKQAAGGVVDFGWWMPDRSGLQQVPPRRHHDIGKFSLLAADIFCKRGQSWATLPPLVAKAVTTSPVVEEVVPVAALAIGLQVLAALTGFIFQYHRYRRPSAAAAVWV